MVTFASKCMADNALVCDSAPTPPKKRTENAKKAAKEATYSNNTHGCEVF